MEIAEHIDALHREGDRLADAAERAGLDAAVPPCSPWLVKDLLRHTGYIHRWAARHITECPEEVLDGPTAARRFELPADVEGDFVVLGDAATVIGSSRGEHDLSGLAGHRLRSHGGLGEQQVPFMVSRALRSEWLEVRRGRRLRNFDIFDAVLNGVVAS